MHVVATAGHVDHGKSTLVRALTGMEPDRWAEEHRRGMTIDLGFVWTRLPTGETVAFVDVPGHERFVPNMLAGIGPAPAVMLVIAADGGWMPQTQEHVAALDALGVRHGVVAVTRADLADAGPVMAAARQRLDGTSLRGAPFVPVSAVTGQGLGELRKALSLMTSQLPLPDTDAPIRLWIDRAFTIRGSGTVITGTLGAGTVPEDDELLLHTADGDRPVRIRGVQALGEPATAVSAVARVAINLRGVDKRDVARGDALLTPGAWHRTAEMDGVLMASAASDVPAELVLHVGSAAVSARVRRLGPESGAGAAHRRALRLRLQRPLPLAAGDAVVLRDPGRHLIVGRFTILDVGPPALTRRGAAAARALELDELAASSLVTGVPDGVALLRKHGFLRETVLTATGTAVPQTAVRAGEWLVDDALAHRWVSMLDDLVAQHRRSAPLEQGPTLEQAAAALGTPSTHVVAELARHPLGVRNGRLIDVTAAPPMPADIAVAVAELTEKLAQQPFSAPDAARLLELGLGPKQLAAAERAGALLRIAPGIVLLPGSDLRAAELMAGLAQPFTMSEARQLLGTTRRVAVPLLELLDSRRLTQRLPDDRRIVRP